MSASTIVFMDLVGFSRNSTGEQRQLVEELTSEVAFHIRTLLNPPFRQPEAIALPTGDGLAIAFLHGPSQEWNRDSLLRLVIAVHRWARRKSEEAGVPVRPQGGADKSKGCRVGDTKPDDPDTEMGCGVDTSKSDCSDESRESGRDAAFEDDLGEDEVADADVIAVRIGIHLGSVELITDINGNPNVCGDAINHAQRVMDAADDGQTLMSDAAFNEYIGTNSINGVVVDDATIGFKGPMQIAAKHGRQLVVYRLYSHGEGWPDEDPSDRGTIEISIVPAPTPVLGSFSRRLRKAQSVALVQLRGERILTRLTSGDLRFGDGLERLLILMPDPATHTTVTLGDSVITRETLEAAINSWERYLRERFEENRTVEVELRLHQSPPSWGASYTDWDRSGGVIHISPYLWHCEPAESPGYDMVKATNDTPPVYGAYSEALTWLRLNSSVQMEIRDGVVRP